MNARNLSLTIEKIEESVGKVLTIFRVEPEEFDDTVLMPIITLKALTEEILELTELLPYIHYSLYIKEIRKLTQKLQKWMKDQPESLELDNLSVCNEYRKIKKDFVDLCYQAHTLPRAQMDTPPVRDHWSIQYQTDHMIESHNVNVRQKERIKHISAATAETQFVKMMAVKAKMAAFEHRTFNKLLSAGPNGLDVPFIYWGDQAKIARYLMCTQYGDQNQAAVKEMEQRNADTETQIPAVIARIQAETDNVPKKRIRSDNNMQL